MRSFQDIYDNILNMIKKRTKQEIAKSSIIDLMITGISEAIYKAHEEIENEKDPHIYTNLKGQKLDDFAMIFPKIRREDGESDQSFLKRVMDWTYTMESSNKTAIENSLTSFQFASYVKYVPMTHGCGTSTFYIIPKRYDEETIEKSIEEVIDRVKDVIPDSSYIEYVISTAKQVRLVINIKSENGDLNFLKDIITNNIKEYINNIAPGAFLKIGDINKIGMNQEQIDFFVVNQLYIDDELINDLEIIQKIESKFLLDNILWIEVE